MSDSAVRCDHPGCIAPMVGYMDRAAGPLFCVAHEDWAKRIHWECLVACELTPEEMDEMDRLQALRDAACDGGFLRLCKSGDVWQES